jgi:hypothetical protein
LQHKFTSTKVRFRYRNGQKGMADYYALISDAIADKKTGESRRLFYDRARAALADRLLKADPPLLETFIEDERLAFEDAIAKAEAVAILPERTPIANGLRIQSDHSEDIRS